MSPSLRPKRPQAFRSLACLGVALVVVWPSAASLGCAGSPEPVEARAEPEDEPDPEPERIEPEPEQVEPEPERAPPWTPPEEPILAGVDGAGQLLARGQAQAALDHLAAVETPPTEGSPSWFIAGAVAGRAHLALGDPEAAVAALEQIAAHEDFADSLPRDLVGYELARARLSWATGEFGLDREAADAQLRTAVRELGGLKKLKPDRIRAAMRVAQGEAMAAIQGEDRKSTRAAANKADKALEKLIASFPNHPNVGQWMLERARAKVRAGKTSEGAEALRRVHIERAGEIEAEQAWAELVALEQADGGDGPSSLSTREALDAGQAARVLRRLDRSQALLDPIWTDAERPRALRREAGHSLAWTLYKQREYSACADVLADLYEEVASVDTRKDLSRCLERAGRYDELLDQWVGVYERKKGATGANALWTAIDLAVKGGRYERATELLAKFEEDYKGHGSERRWLHAWLPLRTGDYETARAALGEMVELGRTGGHDRAAVYFLGKLEIASEDPTVRAEGVARLQALTDEAYARLGAAGVIGGNPVYYGLLARQRLLDAGEDPGPPPTLAPLDWEERTIGHAESLDLLRRMADDHGKRFSSLIRAEQLLRAGWRDEASREVRVAADEFINARAVYVGSGMPGTRTEALVAGLAWGEEWKFPKAVANKVARKAMRDEDIREAMRADFMALTWALDEPYRFAKQTDASLPYRARWHLRAFREPIERHAWAREVDPHHLWALMYTESRFRRHVVSHVGARGALQIMPWTGRQLVERLGEIEPGERFDPDVLFSIEDNSRLSAYYIAELLAKFHGQPTFAYASYNGGPSNVARWLAAKSQGPTGVGLDEFVEEIPFAESARYARRVMEVRAVYDLMYRGQLPEWPNEVDPEFEDNIGF